MSVELWYATGILLLAILLFVTEWLRVDVVALLVVVALMLTGILAPSEAIAGFSHPAVITIAALFVVGGGVMQTGLAAVIGERILMVAGTDSRRLTTVIMLAVAVLSGFMSDTGTVAVLLPAIISLAWRANISPSKLLIPLSFGALLGGASTLIGTPPNIIVSDLLRENGFSQFQFFDFTPIGILLTLSGIAFMLLVGQRLLPDMQPKQALQRVETPQELSDSYRLADNIFRLRVRRGSDLTGKTIAQANLRQNLNINVLEILRPASARPVVRFGQSHLIWQNDASEVISPSPDTAFQIDDILVVQGESNNVGHASAVWNLGLQPAEQKDENVLNTDEIGLAEVVLPPRSQLIGKTLQEVRFGTLYHLTVLGINRPGSEGKLDIKNTRLRFGDILLVQGAWKNILNLRNMRKDFVVMGQPEELVPSPARKRAPIAFAILTGMLVVLVFDLLPIETVGLLAGLLMILSGCLSIDEAYAAIDWKSIVLVAGMIPMSTALEKVGAVNLFSEALSNSLGATDPHLLLAGLFLLTSLFTQVLSNTATTVLIAPIALSSANKLGIEPHAFLMTVAIAASMAMATPVASPVNTLVMGAGNYRFSDYLRVGLPTIFIMLAVSLLSIPILWPF